ncbi:MAG: RNA polymerase sigma factor [Myxococcales bacterium]|nr:RNA polymerase sigma factor [Myxococcales bacterium]MDD9967524.1 RNA polymerase sigma factor [Myxococcales bacterium]
MVARLTSVQPEGEYALLQRAGAGDEQAVRELLRTHAPRLHRHASRILGSHDPDVEDVVQQVFLAALDGAERFDGRSSVATWLFGITTRRALDAARARFRRQRWAKVGEVVGMGGASGQPDTTFQAADEAQVVLTALTPDQRMVFVMHDVEGYTFAEISSLTDVGISTLHSRLKAARKRIASLVAEEGIRV